MQKEITSNFSPRSFFVISSSFLCNCFLPLHISIFSRNRFSDFTFFAIGRAADLLFRHFVSSFFVPTYITSRVGNLFLISFSSLIRFLIVVFHSYWLLFFSSYAILAWPSDSFFSSFGWGKHSPCISFSTYHDTRSQCQLQVYAFFLLTAHFLQILHFELQLVFLFSS